MRACVRACLAPFKERLGRVPSKGLVAYLSNWFPLKKHVCELRTKRAASPAQRRDRDVGVEDHPDRLL